MKGPAEHRPKWLRRGQRTHDIPLSPALDAARDAQAAGVVHTGRNRVERPVWCHCLAFVVPSPAVDRAARAETARVPLARRDRHERNRPGRRGCRDYTFRPGKARQVYRVQRLRGDHLGQDVHEQFPPLFGHRRWTAFPAPIPTPPLLGERVVRVWLAWVRFERRLPDKCDARGSLAKESGLFATAVVERYFLAIGDTEVVRLLPDVM